MKTVQKFNAFRVMFVVKTKKKVKCKSIIVVTHDAGEAATLAVRHMGVDISYVQEVCRLNDPDESVVVF